MEALHKYFLIVYKTSLLGVCLPRESKAKPCIIPVYRYILNRPLGSEKLHARSYCSRPSSSTTAAVQGDE